MSRAECLGAPKARLLFRARTTQKIDNRTLDLRWPIECRGEGFPRTPVEDELIWVWLSWRESLVSGVTGCLLGFGVPLG